MVESRPQTETEKDRVKQLVVRVADQGEEHFRRDLSKLNTVALKFAESSEENHAALIDLVVESSSLIAHKASTYATYIALTTVKNPSLGEAIVERMFESLQKNLDKGGDIVISKAHLIVLGELMNLGLINSFNYIKILLEIITEAEKTLKISKDYFLYLGISVLPYVAEGLMKKSLIEFKNLVGQIKALMNKRNLLYTNVTNPFKEKRPIDRLSELWKVLLEYIESETREPIKGIPRPSKVFEEELANVPQLKKIAGIKLSVTTKNAENCMYQSPCAFQIFDEKVLEEEVASRLDQLVLKDRASDIIFLFRYNKTLLLQMLFTLSNDYKCPNLITDALLSETFRLPNSDSKLIFYSSVLIGLGTDTAPKGFNASIQQAVAALYDVIEKLDIELVDRFTTWLSHYISNAKYQWDWDSWVHVKDLDEDQMKRVFVKSLLLKLVSLSFRTRIAEAVPTELHELLPAESTVFYKYENPKETNFADSEIIRDKLNLKTSSEEMIKLLQSDSSNLEAPTEVIAEIFFDSLLHRGGKALSHFTTLIERYLTFLQYIFKKEADQVIMLESLKRCWVSSPFHQITLIDSLITYKLLNYRTVVNWVFVQVERGNEQSDYCKKYWDILLNTIAKILCLSDNAKGELRKAKVHNLKDEQAKLQKKVEDAVEEEQAMFELVFKKFHKVISDYHDEDKFKYQMTFERFVQVARKYRFDLEPLMEKLEENFSKLDIPEIKNALAAIKELK